MPKTQAAKPGAKLAEAQEQLHTSPEVGYCTGLKLYSHLRLSNPAACSLPSHGYPLKEPRDPHEKTTFTRRKGDDRRQET